MKSGRKALGRMRGWAKRGRIAIDPENTDALRYAVRISQDMQIALAPYKLELFDGAVIILRSEQRRMGEERLEHGRLRDYFVGHAQIFDVGDKHGDVFDIGNDAFARQLQRGVAEAQRSMVR